MTTEHNIASAKYTLQHYCSVSALYCIMYMYVLYGSGTSPKSEYGSETNCFLYPAYNFINNFVLQLINCFSKRVECKMPCSLKTYFDVF